MPFNTKRLGSDCKLVECKRFLHGNRVGYHPRLFLDAFTSAQAFLH